MLFSLSSQVNATVLLAEHDPQTCTVLAESLRSAGCRVLLAANGHKALEVSRSERLDLVVLDGELPLMDGQSVCRALRDDPATSTLPIVLLTGFRNRRSSVQRIAAFETGADDSLTKPCNPREFVLRVEAVLRRTSWKEDHAQNGSKSAGEPLMVVFGPLQIARLHRVVMLDGRSLTLTPKEYHLLDILAGARGLPVSGGRLLKEVSVAVLRPGQSDKNSRRAPLAVAKKTWWLRGNHRHQ